MEIEQVLSPRIVKHCMPLYKDGHFKHAAHEAMIQVEMALKEKVQVKNKRFGHVLVESLFHIGGKEQCIKLRVPLGEELQAQAEQLCKGAFAYYRNYSAHDGSKIDKRQCIRIMILASELLDLIDASSLTFSDIGGVEGLLRAGAFTSEEQVWKLLRLLDGYHIIDDANDGLYEDMWEKLGADELQLQALLELDLVRYEGTDFTPNLEELKVVWDYSPPETVGWFTLTSLGKEFIKAIEEKAS